MSDNFIRPSTNQGSLINRDNNALDAYKRQRDILRKNLSNDERIKQMEDKLNNVENILSKILEKLS